jgi:hypothetical protein
LLGGRWFGRGNEKNLALPVGSIAATLNGIRSGTLTRNFRSGTVMYSAYLKKKAVLEIEIAWVFVFSGGMESGITREVLLRRDTPQLCPPL